MPKIYRGSIDKHHIWVHVLLLDIAMSLAFYFYIGYGIVGAIGMALFVTAIITPVRCWCAMVGIHKKVNPTGSSTWAYGITVNLTSLVGGIVYFFIEMDSPSRDAWGLFSLLWYWLAGPLLTSFLIGSFRFDPCDQGVQD